MKSSPDALSDRFYTFVRESKLRNPIEVAEAFLDRLEEEGDLRVTLVGLLAHEAKHIRRAAARWQEQEASTTLAKKEKQTAISRAVLKSDAWDSWLSLYYGNGGTDRPPDDLAYLHWQEGRNWVRFRREGKRWLRSPEGKTWLATTSPYQIIESGRPVYLTNEERLRKESKSDDERWEREKVAKEQRDAALRRAFEAHAQEVRLQVLDDLLETEFALGDGTATTWGEATAEQHQGRIDWLLTHAGGTLDTAARHQAAINLLREKGIRRLNELRAQVA